MEHAMTFELFGRIYRHHAHQLKIDQYVVEWFATGIAPEHAAAWANLGFTPTEAAGEMTAGRTLDELIRQEMAKSGIHRRR